jgi:putative restriction endonuclease
MPGDQRNWSREETVVAYNLFCKIPFKESTKTSPLIIEIAKVIDRTPSAVAMKIGNLGRLDPELRERGIVGLTNGSKLDVAIWNEFNGNWDELAFESEKVLAKLYGYNISDTVKNNPPGSLLLPEGADKQTIVKVRVNQAFFRSAVLTSYNHKCCITGLSIPQLLVASHIIPWSIRADTRTDPRNGLLLNSVHDKAFDSGLITVTTDYKVKVSGLIREFLPDKTTEAWFIDYEGTSISQPDKFLPSKEFLRWHNENIFIG